MPSEKCRAEDFVLLLFASGRKPRVADMFARAPVRYYRTASLKLDAHKFQQGCAPDVHSRVLSCSID